MDDHQHGGNGHEFEVAMHLLSDGVPLTLLIDLATPPHSRDLYRDEVGDTEWLVGASV